MGREVQHLLFFGSSIAASLQLWVQLSGADRAQQHPGQ